jgi:hypothetical protein
MTTVNCPIECIRTGCNDNNDQDTRNAFLITLIGSLSAVLGLVFSYFLKSRCTNIRTPCISCDREVIEIKKENEINNVA